MPTYEYKCSSCGHRYERKEGFDAPPRQQCPECGAETKRLLFPPPIVFKGSGFYITDSRKGSSVTIGSDGGGTSSDGSKKDNGNGAATESKPAAEAKPAPAATSSDSAG